jgi:hypothetical protein
MSRLLLIDNVTNTKIVGYKSRSIEQHKGDGIRSDRTEKGYAKPGTDSNESQEAQQEAVY